MPSPSRGPTRPAPTRAPGTWSSGPAPDRSRPRLSFGHAASALAQGPDRGAALPSRRRRDAGDHVGHRPLAGDQAPDQGLLGVPRHDHGLAAAEPVVRRIPAAVPLDGAHPELAARRRAVGLRGRRRRLPQEQRHDDGAALQPDEAEPRRRAGPRPHHRRRPARDGQGQPRVPGQAGPDLLPRPRVPVRAQRDPRREGDRAGAIGGSSGSTSPAPNRRPSGWPTTAASSAGRASSGSA